MTLHLQSLLFRANVTQRDRSCVYVLLFADDKLKLKNMFRDPDRVVEILAYKYNILSRMMAERLLESSLNPVAVRSWLTPDL